MRQLILCKGRSDKGRLSSFYSMDANHSITYKFALLWGEAQKNIYPKVT